MPNQSRERHAGAHHRFLAMEVRARETPFEPHHDAANSAIQDEDLVATAQDDDRELLTIGERQRVADVVEVLGYDEDVSGSPGPQRCVEAEGLLEPYGPSDFTKHDLPPSTGCCSHGGAQEARHAEVNVPTWK